ncbi:hypothetical protein DHEL01_v209323 [Diaporthe helianthi]|uniref:DNA mismatch repair protein HSM3 N-terminal domain-containing protein n=1 Tax=Diaporthe helianthi TaxID=158607 RepID=A0A2P5HPY5_DIAHE|nr:hypothetical protein DHEL01_v209323 [Diaporthe helianthi]
MAASLADTQEGQLPLTSQLAELDSHLDELQHEDDPAAHFDASLFDRINYQLGPVEYPELTARLLPKVAAIIKKCAAAAAESSTGWRGYPPPLITLTIKLLRPLPFTQALELCQPEYLVTALASPEPYINELAFAILEKASRSPSDASILASAPGLLEAFLDRWLSSPAVSVGHQGVRILGDLLDVDSPLSQPVFTDDQKQAYDIRLVRRAAQGHGAIWRRLFGGEALCWQLLHKMDTAFPASSTDQSVVAQRSFAQDRFLRLLPRLAVLDFASLDRSTTQLSPGGPTVSLLTFAVLFLVDRRGDALMHLTWIDCMQKLVGALRVADTAKLSVDALRALVRDADDTQLFDTLWGMPDNLIWTPLGEADTMQAWLREVAPRRALRIDRMLNGD